MLSFVHKLYTMKSIFTLLVLLCCSVLFAQRPTLRTATPNAPTRMEGRDLAVANPKIIDGKLTIKANQTYILTKDLLELETLVMMDGATISLRRPKTTMIIQTASVGKNCKIVGVGPTGSPGANGANGVIRKPGQRIVRPGRSPNGKNGRIGAKGGPAKNLDLYVGSIKYREPLMILLYGGIGGKGGDGGDGAAKVISCKGLTVGTNGGNGGLGGSGGDGTLPRIMYGDGVAPGAIVAKAIPGGFGPPGKRGNAGKLKRGACPPGPLRFKKGKPGIDGTPINPFMNVDGQDAGVETEFPYPPPKPSAMVAELPIELPTEATLGTVEDRLRAALQGCGYEDLRYYKVPEGYAIVTGMEQFTGEGVPLTSDRWSGEANFVSEFSLASYLKSLFTPRKGYFRLIVFMVTADDLLTKDELISKKEALGWFKAGWSRLPKEIAVQDFTTEHYVSALIYEFSVSENADEPVFSEPSSLSAEAHLRGAALWNRLVSDQ